MQLAKSVGAVILGLGLALSASGANATLIDNTTYTTDTSFGLDWLDLSATKGLSVAAALSANSGWSYANDTQVANLLGSFGITYGFTPFDVTTLSPSVAQVNNFQSLLGLTAPAATLGGYFNVGATHSNYLCISNGGAGGCSPTSFTFDSDFSGGDPVIGQFLVRASAGTTSVPEPAALALFGAGLAGIGAYRRRKAKA